MYEQSLYIKRNFGKKSRNLLLDPTQSGIASLLSYYTKSKLHRCSLNFLCAMSRVSKFAVENVFNSNATIVVLNSTKTTAINDNEKNLAKNEEKLTSS